MNSIRNVNLELFRISRRFWDIQRLYDLRWQPQRRRWLKRDVNFSIWKNHGSLTTVFDNWSFVLRLPKRSSEPLHGPLLGTSENIFWRDALLKTGFQNLFCSKVPSKYRKCRFRDPNLKIFSGRHAPGSPRIVPALWPPPSLKSWLRHCSMPYLFNLQRYSQHFSLFQAFLRQRRKEHLESYDMFIMWDFIQHRLRKLLCLQCFSDLSIYLLKRNLLDPSLFLPNWTSSIRILKISLNVKSLQKLIFKC